MYRITCRCPTCGSVIDSDLSPAVEILSCAACGSQLRLTGPMAQDGHLSGCLVCPSRELYVRKNFPQRLGLLIVITGFALSTVAYGFRWIAATFGILLGTALVDLLLYVWMGNVLECYACQARYHGLSGMDDQPAFDLEVHERHRQRRARMAQLGEQFPQAGTANPDQAMHGS